MPLKKHTKKITSLLVSRSSEVNIARNTLIAISVALALLIPFYPSRHIDQTATIVLKAAASLPDKQKRKTNKEEEV